MSDIAKRKADHLDLAASGDVGFHDTTTLFECVRLVHDALPELSFDEVDLGSEVLGKRLRAPLLIAAMTGGHPRAERINRELASLAEERGVAFGLGSQRAMLKNPASLASYRVRDVAPSALILGNLGVVQASSMSTQEVQDLVGSVGADALCVHLNPAMEVVQPEGDRDFRNGIATLARLAHELNVPVVAKETGCGLSTQVGRRLQAAGIRHVDVSGAGGTSWVAVETQRASEDQKALGQAFWDWGIPTAASVAFVARVGFETVFATGGVRNGLDVVKALVLGASAGGIARPVLQALEQGGVDGARSFLVRTESEIRTAMLLTGSRTTAALARAPRVILGELTQWLEQEALAR
ncbi:MAG: type 2 isopentenyl-diphosphate Delta-isomerase [Myxococcota bacterium]